MANSRLKTLLDFLPLIVFFVIYKWLGMLPATAALIAVTVVVLVILFTLERKIALVPLVVAIVVSISGGLTLWFNDDTFLKMKPTVVNLFFAAVLFTGCMRGKGWLSYIMGSALSLTDRGWWLLSLRFGCFFAAMAVLNEIVWRNVPTEWWVDFKVFGLMALTFLFMATQIGFIQKFQKPEENSAGT
jgi:intracellular septation protein